VNDELFINAKWDRILGLAPKPEPQIFDFVEGTIIADPDGAVFVSINPLEGWISCR
jgi:hypothetical protein